MYKVNSSSNQRGFTLVELLLVVALVSISVGVTSDILLSLIRSYNKSQVTNEVEQNSNFISQKLTKELRNAKMINSIIKDNVTISAVAPAFGEGIVFTDRDNNQITYRINGGIVSRTFGIGGTASSLNVNAIGGVSASCGSSGCFQILQDAPQVVQISLSMAQGGSSGSKIFEGLIKIEDTIVIRDTY